MKYKVLSISGFDKELKRLAKKHRSIKQDIDMLGAQLADNPRMGDEILQDCYKIRMAITSKGKGKSGGARVITYVVVRETTVFLLALYDKSEQESINEKKIITLLNDLELT